MRVHHLVAGRMSPPLGPAVICHVLLVEHPEGLTLVDSGLGRADLADPKRLGPARHLLRPQQGVTAIDAVEAAGFDAADVAHVVLTHLDFDHVGGALDFPQATWHTTAAEWSAATTDIKGIEKSRYRQAHLGGSPVVQAHPGEGDPWRHGLSAIEVLDGISLVPMIGHTRGHAAVTVEGESGLVVHAGDAVFDASHYDPTLAKIGILRAFEKTVVRIPKRLKGNHAALATLHADPDVTVVNAHDERAYPG
ncbi:MBL fold metallo-hydrolase [Aeromicrobium sp. Leaf350]|uniref:MBL fold metallo-hydrolase n=1 Tax=Aeromicrobium sp. Leaf350 TaxID=2876565 RepID=UPI001E5FD194|nr:MBL fold metallo-hydrolase [Aeromicrobium sp. Leaf350]